MSPAAAAATAATVSPCSRLHYLFFQGTKHFACFFNFVVSNCLLANFTRYRPRYARRHCSSSSSNNSSPASAVVLVQQYQGICCYSVCCTLVMPGTTYRMIANGIIDSPLKKHTKRKSFAGHILNYIPKTTAPSFHPRTAVVRTANYHDCSTRTAAANHYCCTINRFLLHYLELQDVHNVLNELCCADLLHIKPGTE